MCVNVVGVSRIPQPPILSCYSGWIKKRQMVAVLTMPSNKTRFWSSFWHVHKFRVKNQILLFKISFTCITNWGFLILNRKKHICSIFLLIRKNASYLSTLCGSHACTIGWYTAITLTASIPTSTEKNIFVVLAKHRTAPWCWFLREPKRVGASVIILNCFNVSVIL
jgi:hypothetical protein